MSMEKKSLREKVLALRTELSLDERRKKSRMIQDRLISTQEFQEARTVMLFLNFRDEVETSDIAQTVIDLGKTLVLPRCAPKGIILPALIRNLDTDIEPGTWGIREPKKENLQQVNPLDIDCVIVPGAAFDREGYRLGYGGGYYDRFFERLNKCTPKIALAFSCQVVPKVPVEPFDKKIDLLITEEGVIRFQKEQG
jgi:5-formyltetrahydrofolate cyclo-ligase